ncbi:glycosyltransferase family 39 protein [[Mycobacterium] kokjensenii]|uniref:Glycosyltransferase family 39 protein n=1 Tax=[Mycobacterium] kokjensenii TaxID=3064287 RepID=A0ABN9MYS8_9MYCO|nr:glycosyltransferase family 39 protein [Mycolicibacter sp. MU0083]CAJ1497484.1 glycosyltransferase family 39 protein [Mycolicibacter sp. MU0083]
MGQILIPAPVSTATAPIRRRPRIPDAAVIAVIATVLAALGASRPSLWFDEAATLSAATHRSLPELWRMLTHIDAVHGLYYLFMHGWFTVFPATEFWARLPSCLAAGGGAAGVVVLSRMFASRQVSVCAGAVYAILPRITWAGIEARPYAFSALAAVWVTVLWVTALRRNTRALWVGYAIAVVGSTLLSVFAVLMLPVHAAALRRMPGGRAVRRRWVVAAGGAAAAVAPFLWFASGQIRQVGWIRPPSPHTVGEIVVQQYFEQSTPFAALAWLLIAAAVVAVRSGARRPPGDDRGALVWLCVVWLLVPTAAAMTYSVWVKPVYYPRYLIGTAPAMAIVLAFAVTTVVGSRRAVIGIVAVMALAAAPNFVVHQRGRYAKEGWDYSAVADVIVGHARAGDCLLIDNTTRWAPGPIRALTAARPDAFATLTDPGLGPHRQALGRLWDGHLGVAALADRLDRCAVVWTVTDHDRLLPAHQAAAMLPAGARFARSPDGRVLHALGFHVVERWQFTFAQVIRSTRGVAKT